MPKTRDFVLWIVDQLAPLGGIRLRALFGAHGDYCDDLFFAIVEDDILYVKSDPETRQHFLMAGAQPFRVQGKDGGRKARSRRRPA